MVRYAIDKGVNYIDTAYPYHGGMSEVLVGKVLQDGYREKVYLATKLPSWLVKSREDMDSYLNEQLERLKTNYIDFYLIHSLNGDFWSLVKKVDSYQWDLCQIQYNFMDENFQAVKEGIMYAASKGIAVVVMEPLRGGYLVSTIPPDIQEIWDSAEEKRSPVE